MNVTVVVATHGSDTWRVLGDQAGDSIDTPHVRIHLENGTLAQARNKGLSEVKTEYVCFLDADDTLSPGYFDFEPSADVTATAITYENRTRPMIPKVWTHERHSYKYHDGECIGTCLIDGNWIHIGAIIRTDVIKSIGGFKEYPVYEDWALFLELQQNGATFDRNTSSIYQATVRRTPGHRNHSMPLRERNKVHERIYEDLIGMKYEN